MQNCSAGLYAQVPPSCNPAAVNGDLACCPSAVVSINGTCCAAGSVLDSQAACCTLGSLDACGQCDGTGRFFDPQGSCCSSVADASGICCQVCKPPQASMLMQTLHVCPCCWHLLPDKQASTGFNDADANFPALPAILLLNTECLLHCMLRLNGHGGCRTGHSLGFHMSDSCCRKITDLCWTTAHPGTAKPMTIYYTCTRIKLLQHKQAGKTFKALCRRELCHASS